MIRIGLLAACALGLGLGLGACAAPTAPPVDDANAFSFYEVAPATPADAAGFAVKLSNRTTTPCADGTHATACPVDVVDWAAIPSAERASLGAAFTGGHALLRADLAKDAATGKTTLTIREVWLGQTGKKPAEFTACYRVEKLATPTREAKLSSSGVFELKQVTYDHAGAGAADVAARHAGEDVIVCGYNSGSAADGYTLDADEIYVQVGADGAGDLAPTAVSAR